MRRWRTLLQLRLGVPMRPTCSDRNCWLRVLGVIRSWEASDHCQLLLDVLVESYAIFTNPVTPRWRRNGCNAEAGAELSVGLGLV